MCSVSCCVHTMKFLGLGSSPKSSAVTSPQALLPHRLPVSSMSIATWFLVILATAAIDTPASTVPPIQDNRSPHIVAQFPAGNGQQYGYFPLDGNTTREGALRFNHLVIDPSTGRLYAGAINRLFQLDSSLKLEEYVSTGQFSFFFFCLFVSACRCCSQRKVITDSSFQDQDWIILSVMRQVACQET